MESKKLLEELFEEKSEESEVTAGATDAQCHAWYVYMGYGANCFGTGAGACSLWLKNCQNPRRT